MMESLGRHTQDSISGSREGRVVSVNVSNGGVPKHPVTGAHVSSEGLEGDRQRNLKHHGGPDRAVCLYSMDFIEELLGEGHPIAPGTVGENLTVAGIDWTLMVPGARVTVGAVELELTAYAHPCRNISDSFREGRFNRISAKTHADEARVYARVVVEGTVQPGDPVRVDDGADPTD